MFGTKHTSKITQNVSFCF